MPAPTAFPSAAAAYELPRLVRLAPNLFGACFTLMKLVPARYILARARRSGQLGPDTVIVETTSGTFGLALAIQAVHMRRKLTLVSDPVIDDALCRRLVDLGAVVERVPHAAVAEAGGYQAARLARLAEIRAGLPETFCPEQYTNPDNPRSYAVVADLLVKALGRVDCLVGPVGSGGSMCGTAGALRYTQPALRAIAVDTHASVLFGLEDGPRMLRGLGMSMLPTNLDHRVFDDVHWCPAASAYTATRQLHRRHGLFMGPTSGAAYLVARWWARTNPDALTVVMLPDEGYRYQGTVYDNRWLAANGRHRTTSRAGPVEVGRPAEAGGEWTWLAWRRRTLSEVTGSDSGAAVAR